MQRFLSVDPLASEYPSWSTYNYALGNPIKYIDPDGRNGEEGDPPSFLERMANKATDAYSYVAEAVDHGMMAVGGMANAVSSNMTGGFPGTRANPADQGEYAQAFATGQAIGDAVSVVAGTAEMVVGGTSSVAVTSTGVGVTATPATVAVTAHGAATAYSGLKNLVGGNDDVVYAKDTPPELPEKTLAKKDGVSIEHYYRSNDHAPAHAHVKGGGKETRIGPNGHPISTDPPMTSVQQKVYDSNKSQIRRKINKIGKWLDYYDE